MANLDNIYEQITPSLCALIERSSWKTCRSIGALLGLRVSRSKRIRREQAVRNLQISFPRMTSTRAHQIVRRARQTEMINICELLRLRSASGQDVRDHVEVQGWEHLYHAMEDGRGAVLTTAHLGPFYLMGARLAQEWTFTTLSAPGFAPVLQKRIEIARQTVGINAIPPVNGVKTCYSTLRAQGMVALFIDLAGGSQDPCGNFLNHRVRTQASATRLALTCGAPIVPISAVRTRPWISDGKIIVKVGPPLRLDYASLKNPEEYKAQVERGTQYALAAASNVIQQYPEELQNWHCLQDFGY